MVNNSCCLHYLCYKSSISRPAVFRTACELLTSRINHDASHASRSLSLNPGSAGSNTCNCANVTAHATEMLRLCAIPAMGK